MSAEGLLKESRTAPRRRFLQISLRSLLILMLVAACVCFWARQRTDRWPVMPGSVLETGGLSAPLVYEDLMLVVTDAHGAAAVVFADEIENERFKVKGVGYRYRYESKDGKTILSGSGEVYEKQNPDGSYGGGRLWLAAGPIKVGWSYGGPGKGWIYYSPEKVHVHMAHARTFDGDKWGAQSDSQIEILDLRRFMEK